MLKKSFNVTENLRVLDYQNSLTFSRQSNLSVANGTNGAANAYQAAASSSNGMGGRSPANQVGLRQMVERSQADWGKSYSISDQQFGGNQLGVAGGDEARTELGLGLGDSGAFSGSGAVAGKSVLEAGLNQVH